MNLFVSGKKMAVASFAALLLTLPLGAPSMAQDDEGRPELSPMSRVPDMRAEMADDSDDRVFGGKEADKGEWPFQVALLTSERLDADPASQPNAQFCGGSLIAPQWVLTAAHCLHSSGEVVAPESITVLSEATNLAEGKRFAVTKVIVNEGYDPSRLDNDIGLVQLAEPATAKPISLVTDDVESGEATVIGWGMMDNGTFPNDLMEANIKLFPNSACNSGIKEIYAKDIGAVLRQLSRRMRYSEKAIEEATKTIAANMTNPLTGNMLCAGEADGARDACNGDSGGPLFMMVDGNPVQVGVVSWGDGPMDEGAACGHANAYGIYTRLANYKDWIAAKMVE